MGMFAVVVDPLVAVFKLRVAFGARVIAFKFRSVVPAVWIITVPPAFRVVANAKSTKVLPPFKLIVAPARVKAAPEASLGVLVVL